MRSFLDATSLNVETMSAISGSRDLGNRTAKSPLRRSRRPASNSFRSAREMPPDGSSASRPSEAELRSARPPPLLDARRDRRGLASDVDALSLRPGRSRSTCGSRSPATGTPYVQMGLGGKELFVPPRGAHPALFKMDTAEPPLCPSGPARDRHRDLRLPRPRPP